MLVHYYTKHQKCMTENTLRSVIYGQQVYSYNANNMIFIGVVLYILLSGYPPFCSESEEDIKKMVIAR